MEEYNLCEARFKFELFFVFSTDTREREVRATACHVRLLQIAQVVPLDLPSIAKGVVPLLVDALFQLRTMLSQAGYR